VTHVRGRAWRAGKPQEDFDFPSIADAERTKAVVYRTHTFFTVYGVGSPAPFSIAGWMPG
jgi:magnesium transporter